MPPVPTASNMCGTISVSRWRRVLLRKAWGLDLLHCERRQALKLFLNFFRLVCSFQDFGQREHFLINGQEIRVIGKFLQELLIDRKSTRLNSSHRTISYA